MIWVRRIRLPEGDTSRQRVYCLPQHENGRTLFDRGHRVSDGPRERELLHEARGLRGYPRGCHRFTWGASHDEFGRRHCRRGKLHIDRSFDPTAPYQGRQRCYWTRAPHGVEVQFGRLQHLPQRNGCQRGARPNRRAALAGRLGIPQLRTIQLQQI